MFPFSITYLLLRNNILNLYSPFLFSYIPTHKKKPSLTALMYIFQYLGRCNKYIFRSPDSGIRILGIRFLLTSSSWSRHSVVSTAKKMKVVMVIYKFTYCILCKIHNSQKWHSSITDGRVLYWIKSWVKLIMFKHWT